ncbi:MAG: BACON domain-containing protein [Bacteroidales bacterium]|nr:BACON domain-containing protein [Bacteroidales bacterium]
MKKILSLIASVAVFAGLWSCTPDEKPVVPGIDITGESTFNVPAADVPTISITFTSTVSWTAEASDEWVTIAPKKGDAGEATIKVNVDDNKLADPRSLKVTVTAAEVVKEFTINQEGAFVPHFDVDPSSCQFSGFGDGEPYSIEKEAGEYVIPVSTNLEWDTYLAIWDSELGQAVVTDHNAWLSLTKVSEGIKVTVTDNETYDARVEYVYVACHVGDDYETYGGFGACILVSQAGLEAPTVPTLVWAKSYADLDENIEATGTTRLAWSEGEIMLSDGNAVYGLDPATGALWDVFEVAAKSIDSDDEGNLIIMNDVPAEYDEGGNVVGPKALQIMWTPSIYDAPTALYTMDYTNQAWGTLGNFRVRGNIAGGKAVVTAAVGASRFYYAWAFDNKEYVKTSDAFDPIRSSLNANGDGNDPNQIGVISVAPDKLTDGVIYRGYVTGQPDGDQSTYLRVDPTVPQWSNPVWKLVSTLGSGGNECQCNIDILDINGKRIMAYTQGSWFNWGPYNANIYVFDITDLNDIQVLANIPTSEWIGDEPTPAGLYLSGADILLRESGGNVELYAVNACLSRVAKYIFGLE